MKVPLCGEQTKKPVMFSTTEYFYVCCQREEGHEGGHVGQWFGQQIHWSVTAKVGA